MDQEEKIINICINIFFFEKQKDQLKQNNRQIKRVNWLFNKAARKRENPIIFKQYYGRYCGLKNHSKNEDGEETLKKLEESILHIFTEENKRDTSIYLD